MSQRRTAQGDIQQRVDNIEATLYGDLDPAIPEDRLPAMVPLILETEAAAARALELADQADDHARLAQDRVDALTLQHYSLGYEVFGAQQGDPQAPLIDRVDDIEHSLGDVNDDDGPIAVQLESVRAQIIEVGAQIQTAVGAVGAQLDERIERKLNAVLARQDQILAKLQDQDLQLFRLRDKLRTPEEHAAMGLRVARAIVNGEFDMTIFRPDERADVLAESRREVAAANAHDARFLRAIATGEVDLAAVPAEQRAQLQALSQEYVRQVPVPSAAELDADE